MGTRFDRTVVSHAARADADRYAAGRDPAFEPSEPHAIVEYRYGARNRPIGYATAPKGIIRIEPRPDPAADKKGCEIARHGIVVYAHALSDEDVAAFELVPFLDAAARDEAVREIAAGMAEYKEDYLGMRDEEPAYLRGVIMHALQRLHPNGAHVGDAAEFVGQVLVALQGAAPTIKR